MVNRNWPDRQVKEQFSEKRIKMEERKEGREEGKKESE
jgi:hypothetical protein